MGEALSIMMFYVTRFREAVMFSHVRGMNFELGGFDPYNPTSLVRAGAYLFYVKIIFVLFLLLCSISIYIKF